MKTLGIIPARGGSKGIPKKNIKLLCGKPLIAYTIKSALGSILDRVIVSTDCAEIAEVSRRYGAEVMMRPNVLAKDDTPTLPVLKDVVDKLDGKYDVVVTLQPTSPLRTAKHINESLILFEKEYQADSLVSVVEIPHSYSPEKLMTFDGQYLNGNLQVKRRQDMQEMFARNGAAIYITKIENLSKYIFGGKILPYFMRRIDSFDIDDIEDWKMVEKIIGI